MPKLTGKLGTWELPYVHMWKDRDKEIRFQKKPIISSETRIVTIGSCFAEELANAMDRLDLNGAMHPTGLFYNTRSICQEIERIFGGWPAYTQEQYWRVEKGYIHPFKSYYDIYPTLESLQEHSNRLDSQAEELFNKADLIVITLGLIETWMQPRTGNFYRQIPPPDVFEWVGANFYRLTVGDMLQDLSRIRAVLRKNTDAEIIVTVSPVPLHSTFTPLDVRVANTESKSRIRGAVSEFIEKFPDVHYFHSYEIVSTAERLSDFMMEDGRHVHRRAVDYIIQQFLMNYANSDILIPSISTSWMTPPEKVSPRVYSGNRAIQRKIIDRLSKYRKSLLKL